MQELKALVIQVIEIFAIFVTHTNSRIPEEEPEASRYMNTNFQGLWSLTQFQQFRNWHHDFAFTDASQSMRWPYGGQALFHT